MHHLEKNKLFFSQERPAPRKWPGGGDGSRNHQLPGDQDQVQLAEVPGQEQPAEQAGRAHGQGEGPPAGAEALQKHPNALWRWIRS